MLSASSGPRWVSTSEVCNGVAIGWCGWRQPDIVSGDGVVVAVDGHVYNAASLGGRPFSGAALVAALYRRHGFEETLARLNGDFAIALYDEAAGALWLARDRFGVKPLYYLPDPGRFAFASRPRALFALPWVTAAPNIRFTGLYAGSHYRYFDNEPSESAYAGIAQLPAAHVLRLARGQIAVKPFWTLADRPDALASERDLADEYRELLIDAVRIRVGATARPVFTLSGGMDSSSVLAATVRVTGERQPAMSVTYDDASFDESDEIRSAVDVLADPWRPLRVGIPDVTGVIERMVAAHDEPVATATWLSHFLLCEEAHALGYDAVLGGLGGDELNAGEYEHFLYFFADLRIFGDEERLGREVAGWAHHHSHPLYPKNPGVVDAAFRRLVDLREPGLCLPDTDRLRRYRDVLDRDFFDLDAFVPVTEHPFTSYLKNRTYQDLTRETVPCCLRAEDRQTTAFDLDHMVPFLDHRLVEFAYRVPGTLKFRDGVSKHLLREAMRGVLPEVTRTRIKKTGWNAPAHVWLAGRGRELLMDLVGSRTFRERGIYDVRRVRDLIDEHDDIVSSGRVEENHMMFLWQLVNLELWLQHLQDAVPVEAH